MQLSGVPTRFPIPFADAAGPGYIRNVPEASQIGVQAGAASLTDGFPPLTFLPIGAGGIPPFGEDFNGLLNQITQWCQWVGAGGVVNYNVGYAGNIGGYPRGALLSGANPGEVWLNLADDNVTDPNSGGAVDWILLANVVQVQNGVSTYAVDSGTANALVANFTPAFTQYHTGMMIKVLKSNAPNTNATPTIDVNGLGPKVIRRNNGTAIVAGDLVANAMLLLIYDGTNFRLAGLALSDVQEGLPIGGIMDYAGPTAPTRWMLCHGQAISRATYSGLFSAIGTTYGPGDGATTFNLPDLRGRILAGLDNMGGVSANRLTSVGVSATTRGAAFGADTHTLNIAQIPAHTHPVTATAASNGAHTHVLDATAADAGAHTHTVSGTAATAGTHAHTVNGAAASAGVHSHIVSGTTNVAGFHAHNLMGRTQPGGGIGQIPFNSSGTPGVYDSTIGAGDHSHTISGTAANAGAHTHTVSGTAESAGAHTHSVTGTAASAGVHTHVITGTAQTAGAHTHAVSGTATSIGGGEAHNNLQPTMVMNKIIKVL